MAYCINNNSEKTFSTLVTLLSTILLIIGSCDDAKVAAAAKHTCLDKDIGFTSMGAIAMRVDHKRHPVMFEKTTFNHPLSGWTPGSGTLSVVCPGYYDISFGGTKTQFSLRRVFGDNPNAKTRDEIISSTFATGGTVGPLRVYLYPADFITLESTLFGTDLKTVSFSLLKSTAQ